MSYQTFLHRHQIVQESHWRVGRVSAKRVGVGYTNGIPLVVEVVLEKEVTPTFCSQDLRIPKALLMTCSHASLGRAHESKTIHMSRGSVLDFVLFDLGMVTY